MSYVQILDHLDHQGQQEDLYKFRAITGHQGPLSPQDENYKGSKYNVMVEWETGEKTDELLFLIAADDPVTCAEYAKRHDLLHLDGCKRLAEFWGLPPLILFFNTSTGWFERFVLSTECYRTRRLGYKNLSWPRCSARVTESLALTCGGFC